jgi:DNA topoisomerase-1
VKYGAKYASLKKDDDPYRIGLERALEIVRDKEAADVARTLREFPEAGIRVMRGRFGPYVTDHEGRRASLPKGTDAASLELAEARRLLDEAPAKKKAGARKKKAATNKTAAAGGTKKAPAKKKAKRKTAGKKRATKKSGASGPTSPRPAGPGKDGKGA